MNYFEHWWAMQKLSYFAGYWIPPLVILGTYFYCKHNSKRRHR